MIPHSKETLRWLLEVAGFVFLLVACAFHSWTWDAAGIGLLVLSIMIDPPASVKAAVLSALLTTSPLRAVDEEIQAAFRFTFPDPKVHYARCEWATKPCGKPATIRSYADTH